MFRTIIKALLRLPVEFLNRVFFWIYLNMISKKLNSLKMISIKKKRVLIIAPHQDDELIGCGFLINNLFKNDCEVSCVFMTDGAGSFTTEYQKDELVQKRRAEAKEVSKYLNINEPYFLNFPDGMLEENDETVKALFDVICEFKPDIVFIPYFLDGHKDHVTTSGIYISAIKKYTDFKKVISFAYEINSPITVYGITHYVFGKDYFDIKKKALEKYHSQTMSFDSLLLMNQMNKYLINEKIDAVELFIQIDIDKYDRMYRRYNSNNDLHTRFRQMYSIYFMIPSYLKSMNIKKEIALSMKSSNHVKGDMV